MISKCPILATYFLVRESNVLLRFLSPSFPEEYQKGGPPAEEPAGAEAGARPAGEEMPWAGKSALSR